MEADKQHLPRLGTLLVDSHLTLKCSLTGSLDLEGLVKVIAIATEDYKGHYSV